MQMLALFAPHTVQPAESLPFLRAKFTSPHITIRSAALQCVRQFAQIAPTAVSQDGIEDELLLMLDKERDVSLRSEIELLITTLVDQLAPTSPARWLEIFKRIISATTRGSATAGAASKDGTEKEPEEDEDEDDAAGGALTQPVEIEDDGTFIPRWRTRVFCMECIKRILAGVRSDKREHFDLALARKLKEREQAGSQNDYLVLLLHDLVSISFNGATSAINALRPVGVSVLKDVIERFAHSMDPDFEGHPLLEIYSAQIAAALRPAFDKDAPPSLTAAACEVVVLFVSKNLTTDVGYDSRIELRGARGYTRPN